MPNWAAVCYKVTGQHEQVEKLYNIMLELGAMPFPGLVENGFGSEWFGNLVTKLGGDPNKVYCRGSWTNLQYSDGILTIDIESAWDELNELRAFLEDTFPDIKIWYQCEESGCGIYTTNDPDGTYFPDRYYLWDELGMDCEYYSSLDALLKAVENKTGSKHLNSFNAAEKAMATYSRRHNDSSYTIEEFKVVE